MMITIQRYDGEWVDVTCERSVQCCDCGLVHEEDYRIIEGQDGQRIIRQAFRNNRLTAARRRSLKARKEGIFAKKKKI
jgi:hypothetical protein